MGSSSLTRRFIMSPLPDGACRSFAAGVENNGSGAKGVNGDGKPFATGPADDGDLSCGELRESRSS